MAVSQVIADRYELEETVGAGGMSTVYCAFDTLLERNVALKILHDQYGKDEEYVERFRREARAVAQLSHPNIVTVIDRGEENGRQFIVFELVDGENLKELVERGGPLPVRRVLELGLEVGRALAFAHAQGLVHRDVKPQNVLLNGDGRAKVTDFGIARSLDAVGHDRDRHRARNEPLHRARAGPRRAGRRADRRLLLRRRPLRAAGRRRALPGRQLPLGRDEARQRSGAERARRAARRAAPPRDADRALACEGAGRAARVDGRGGRTSSRPSASSWTRRKATRGR